MKVKDDKDINALLNKLRMLHSRVYYVYYTKHIKSYSKKFFIQGENFYNFLKIIYKYIEIKCKN